jgi:hypothetical protein
MNKIIMNVVGFIGGSLIVGGTVLAIVCIRKSKRIKETMAETGKSKDEAKELLEADNKLWWRMLKGDAIKGEINQVIDQSYADAAAYCKAKAGT